MKLFSGNTNEQASFCRALLNIRRAFFEHCGFDTYAMLAAFGKKLS